MTQAVICEPSNWAEIFFKQHHRKKRKNECEDDQKKKPPYILIFMRSGQDVSLTVTNFLDVKVNTPEVHWIYIWITSPLPAP